MEKDKKNFKSKFTEAYNTPIPHQPFVNTIDQDGLTKEAEEILQGNYVFPPVIHPDILDFSPSKNDQQYTKRRICMDGHNTC